MIKFNVVKKQVTENSFPKLMEYDGLVVLMYKKNEFDHGSGTVLVTKEDDDWDLGQYFDHWNLDVFKDFNNTIMLSNKEIH